MTLLSSDAADTIRLVRELRMLDESTVKTLEQLFSNRINDDLIASLVQSREEALAVGLYKVATGASTIRIRGYVLRFMADLSQISHSFAKEFSSANSEAKFGVEPASIFLDLAIQHEKEAGIASAALHLAAVTIRHAAGSLAKYESTLTRFFAHVSRVLAPAAIHVSDIEYPVHACAQLVRRKALRPYFITCGIIEHLPKVLTEACATETSSLIQLSYEALLICWMLSFEFPCIVALHKAKIIPTVHRVLQRIQKEKCVRVALMTLRNFASAQQKYYNLRTNGASETSESSQIYALGDINNGKGPSFFADMIGVGLVKTLWQLARRKFGDDDITKEIEELTVVLDHNLEIMSSFSEYKGEVQSGLLEWSPVHTSTKFWKENASKFEENNYEILRELKTLIFASRNELTLAVACHDVGELVRHHPSGRMLLQLQQFEGVKEKIMQLMSHENPDVAKNALVAVQKIMVQRWEFIK